MVLSEQIDVPEAAGPHPPHVILANAYAFLPKLPYNLRHMNCVDDNHGVRDQVKITGLQV